MANPKKMRRKEEGSRIIDAIRVRGIIPYAADRLIVATTESETTPPVDDRSCSRGP